MYKSEIYYTTIWYQWGVGEQRKRNLTSTSKTKNKTFKNSDNICRFVMCSRMCSRGSTLQSLLLAVHEFCVACTAFLALLLWLYISCFVLILLRTATHWNTAIHCHHLTLTPTLTAIHWRHRRQNTRPCIYRAIGTHA